MKCIVPGPNVKVLGRAIHSLAKLGEELYVESSANDLSFRVVNSSKTAYASFSFSDDFFSFFTGGYSENPNNNFVKCQISMKSSLAVFRSPITLDKTVESLQIQLQPNSDKLVFLVRYKKGVFKTHYVPIIECETLQAYYHKDDSPNKLMIQPKIIGEILSNFQTNQDEITWLVTKDRIVIRNYTESEDAVSGVRTETSLQKDEFDEFKIEEETEITFCLKELRAVLLFSDSVSLPLTANFYVSSKPIVFIVKNEVYEANFVVSTLTGKDYVESQTQTQNRATQNRARKENESVNRRTVNNQVNESVHRRIANNQVNEIRAEPSINVSRFNNVSQNLSSQNNQNTSVSNQNKQKLKRVFSECFKREAVDVRNIPGYDEILAPDSDQESEKEY